MGPTPSPSGCRCCSYPLLPSRPSAPLIALLLAAALLLGTAASDRPVPTHAPAAPALDNNNTTTNVTNVTHRPATSTTPTGDTSTGDTETTGDGSSDLPTWTQSSVYETERMHYSGEVSSTLPTHPSPPSPSPSSFPSTNWTSPSFEWGPREAAVLPPKAQQHESGGMPLGAIAGIVIGVVFALAIAGVGLYIMVRRWRLANLPQTLSDKSSNPDSFGYIDDSVRDAEEMLSLDNDSFLNSLEAVTFQNYWTDSVRHTKL